LLAAATLALPLNWLVKITEVSAVPIEPPSR